MKNSCGHLWVLECPVEHSHTRVHSYIISYVYATIISVMKCTMRVSDRVPLSTATRDMGVEMRK